MMDYLVGFDPADTSTWVGVGKAPGTYSSALEAGALKGARIGFVTELVGDGSHPEHAWVTSATMKAIEAMRAAGAEVIELRIPQAGHYAHNTQEISVSSFEVKWTMDAYFAGNGEKSKYRTLADYVAAAADTHPPVYQSLKRASEAKEDVLRSPEYEKRLKAQAAFRDRLVAVMDEHRLDSLFYPHQRRLVVPAAPDADQVERNGFMGSSTGLPAITVPGGFSPSSAEAPIGVPIGVEFLGRPFSESRLIALAYAFEQQTNHRRPPASTPSLPGETFTY